MTMESSGPQDLSQSLSFIGAGLRMWSHDDRRVHGVDHNANAHANAKPGADESWRQTFKERECWVGMASAVVVSRQAHC